MRENNEKREDQSKPEECISVSDDLYFWNELRTIVEDGAEASQKE
jgi:hypothetical protein